MYTKQQDVRLILFFQPISINNDGRKEGVNLSNQCIRFHEFGTPSSVLKVEEKENMPLKDGEILVKMILSPINPSDLIPVRGAYSHRISLPGIPGYEGVGIVTNIGNKVSESLIGERVLPLRGEGTWQEYVKAPAEYAVVIPEEIDDYSAATLYINPLTAWVICREKLTLTPGNTLVVNACGSFIGRIFAQLSKKIGFTLIAVIRNNKHAEDLKALGASFVINSSRENVRQKILEITNAKGADAAIDCIGGKDGTELAWALRPQGVLMTLGLLSNEQVDWDNIYKYSSVNVALFHLRHWNKSVSGEEWQAAFKQLKQMIVNNELNLNFIDCTYQLSNIKDAIQYIKSPVKQNGKVFLEN